MIFIFTPRACARGKAISFVRLSAQKSPDLEIEASLRDGSIITDTGRWEMYLSSLIFLELEKGHERYRSRVSIGHTFQPHLVMPRAALTVHARTHHR